MSSLIVNKLCRNCLFIRQKPYFNKLIHTTKILTSFWERNKRGKYHQNQVENVSQKQLLLSGLKELKTEIAMWTNEVKEKLISDPIIIYRPGEVDVIWSFNTENDFDKWITTSDSDHNEGYSTCTFNKSAAGYGLFSGNVDSKLTIDGKLKRTGYCNLNAIRPTRSFHRYDYHDWGQYNTLVLKVRGDGRSYLLNLATEGYFDVTWNDVYHYMLYTRGGPHWQIARIPFAKFFLSSKGRVQDRQFKMPSHKITNMGISVGARGGHEGAFNLEIAYIGVEFDPLNIEEFSYEMYKMPKYIVAT